MPIARYASLSSMETRRSLKAKRNSRISRSSMSSVGSMVMMDPFAMLDDGNDDARPATDGGCPGEVEVRPGTGGGARPTTGEGRPLTGSRLPVLGDARPVAGSRPAELFGSRPPTSEGRPRTGSRGPVTGCTRPPTAEGRSRPSSRCAVTGCSHPPTGEAPLRPGSKASVDRGFLCPSSAFFEEGRVIKITLLNGRAIKLDVGGTEKTLDHLQRQVASEMDLPLRTRISFLHNGEAMSDAKLLIDDCPSDLQADVHELKSLVASADMELSLPTGMALPRVALYGLTLESGEGLFLAIYARRGELSHTYFCMQRKESSRAIVTKTMGQIVGHLKSYITGEAWPSLPAKPASEDTQDPLWMQHLGSAKIAFDFRCSLPERVGMQKLNKGERITLSLLDGDSSLVDSLCLV
eukprot:TRINITY_DN63914_c0_g1_i1.p1 TRINITY_DN63914_c0_g1~~TRINITY_DN63914_c0_g1_i1.p1  ORF type:complete len:432 (+),score=84.78 TRINITY_DN63914_c0_g1_i1:75-1298(+)